MKTGKIKLNLFIKTFLFLLLPTLVVAQDSAIEKWVSSDTSTSYDVYYEIGNFAVDNISSVKIGGVTSIGNQSFLVVIGSGFTGKEKEGYISLNAVRAILPNGYFKVERIFDKMAR